MLQQHDGGPTVARTAGRATVTLPVGSAPRIRARLAALVAALLAVLALALAGCANAGTANSGDGASAPPLTGADVMFVQMMIPHHEQAIEMSDIVLAKPDVDPRVADLATRIRDAQDPEIELMRGWLDDWGLEEMTDPAAHGDHAGMDGMLTEDELQALRDADGATASRGFVEGMIAHHEGAVVMAEEALAGGVNPDVLALAQTVIDTQQAEIDEMTALLPEL